MITKQAGGPWRTETGMYVPGCTYKYKYVQVNKHAVEQVFCNQKIQ